MIGVSVMILVQLLELSLNARKFFNSPDTPTLAGK